MSLQVSIEETPDSRSETLRPPSYTLQYRVVGEPNDANVHLIALNNTPVTATRNFAVLHRQDIQIEPDGWANYLVTVPYGPLKREVGEVSFTFDTSGATINVKAAREHVATYAAAGLVASGDQHAGAIGVTGDGDVEGVDIVVPALKLTYQFKHPQAQITEAQVRVMAGWTGATNADVFRGFQPGELLFLGASGSDGSNSEAEVSYQYVASSNTSNLTVGAISGIAKKGHDAFWIEFEDEVDEGSPVRQPKRVHIERVYDAINFQAAFPWG